MKIYLLTYLRLARSYKYSYRGAHLFFLILLIACTNEENRIPNNCEVPTAADAYIYPIVPGMPEWADLNTGEKKMEVCQIPHDHLESMTTAGLVESWCEFPLNLEIYLIDDYQYTIDFLITNFSGLQELSRRNDAGKVLMERYQHMKPACVAVYNDERSKGDFTLNFLPVELLLAQDIILDKLSLVQKKALLAEAILKYREKKQYLDEFGIVAGTALPLFICSRILENTVYQPFISDLNNSDSPILSVFLNTGILYVTDPNAPDIQKILKHSETFLNQM